MALDLLGTGVARVGTPGRARRGGAAWCQRSRCRWTQRKVLRDGGPFAGMVDERMRLCAKFVEFFVDGRQLIVLEGNEESPVIFAAHRKGRPIGEQSVEQQGEREAREPFLQPAGQSGKKALSSQSCLVMVSVGFLDELAEHGHGKPRGGHELGLQHVMIIHRLAVAVLFGQTVGAMAFGIDQQTGPIDGDGKNSAPRAGTDTVSWRR